MNKDQDKDNINDKKKHNSNKMRWFLLGVLVLYAWKRNADASPDMEEEEQGLSGFDDYY